MQTNKKISQLVVTWAPLDRQEGLFFVWGGQ